LMQARFWMHKQVPSTSTSLLPPTEKVVRTVHERRRRKIQARASARAFVCCARQRGHPQIGAVDLMVIADGLNEIILCAHIAGTVASLTESEPDVLR
jgi:hypothetical protein